MSRSPLAVVAALALALGGLTGCRGHVETHAVLLRAPVPGPSSRVEVYVVGQAPARRFYEMGFVQAVGFADTANPEDLVRGLVQKGQELGCEAVVRVQVDVGYTKAHASGVCVRWLDAATDTTYVAPALPSAPRPTPSYRPTPAPRPLEPSPSNINPGRGN